ncbi:unnamed protein product [Durusdinium trenchii]|uniref:Uncharacterized protein n=1 Tax=Durusdinium trenchii TaxID=1381693 RepID=A0ABP0KJZ6_9DINO
MIQTITVLECLWCLLWPGTSQFSGSWLSWSRGEASCLAVDLHLEASLIIWTKSHAFRRSAEYRALYDLDRWKLGKADQICLSYSHDDDYEELMPDEMKFQMPTHLAEAAGTASSTDASGVPINRKRRREDSANGAEPSRE